MRVRAKTKASFLIAYEIIESHEGGYANVPGDLGEETYCGISRKFSKEWTGWYYIDQWKRYNGSPKWNYHFNGVTEWLATEFYVDLWIKEGFFALENQSLANYLFDFRVHSPIGVKLIQEEINEYGYVFALDNKMSSGMIDALNKIDSQCFLKSIKDKRIDFYKQIVDRNPSQRKFLSHWLKRANV